MKKAYPFVGMYTHDFVRWFFKLCCNFLLYRNSEFVGAKKEKRVQIMKRSMGPKLAAIHSKKTRLFKFSNDSFDLLFLISLFLKSAPSLNHVIRKRELFFPFYYLWWVLKKKFLLCQWNKKIRLGVNKQRDDE